MKGRPDDPSHHERTLLPTELHLAPEYTREDYKRCTECVIPCSTDCTALLQSLLSLQSTGRPVSNVPLEVASTCCNRKGTRSSGSALNRTAFVYCPSKPIFYCTLRHTWRVWLYRDAFRKTMCRGTNGCYQSRCLYLLLCHIYGALLKMHYYVLFIADACV